LSAKDLVARAASLGIEVLGITDHDTTESVPPALAEGRQQGVVVVPGVEISAVSGREEIHLLGYFVDPENEELQTLLALAREARRERAQKMLVRLAELGLPIEWDRLVEVSGGSGSIGRPHVATTLLEAGHVNSYDEAFDLWIGRGGPAYVERYKLFPEEAVRLLKRSGGLPVLAHPYVYSRNGQRRLGLDLEHWLPRLLDAGLEGIEVYYPNYPREARQRLLELVVKHGLLITGGSDFHGGMLGNGLGSVAVPWAVWEGLERRHRLTQARPDGKEHAPAKLVQGAP
jgi:predicted metal-dependent phosphoesterase TrpH